MDTRNKFGVGTQGNMIVILTNPGPVLNKEEALNLAAWLVAMADDEDRFEILLNKVSNL